MKTSDNIADLAAALAKAQSEFAALEPNRDVKVTMKSGGSYSFSYVTLDAIVDMVRGPLSRNGLAWSQGVDGSQNGTVVQTILMHGGSGQWISTVMPVRINESTSQALGSGVSYAKRYALSALLGIVSESDDDANGSDGNTVTTVRHNVVRRSSPPGISDMRTKVNNAVGDIGASTDWETLEGWMMQASTKALMVKVCGEFTSLWRGEMPGSGLAGCLEVAGDQLGKASEIADYLGKVEKAAADRKVA